MGLSQRHASTAALVLNPQTGSITPQFHVVYDDWLSTIATDPEDLPDFNSDEWHKLFGESNYQYIEDDSDTHQDDTPPNPQDSNALLDFNT